MKKQKKYGLFVAIAVCFLAYVVLSWFVPTGSISQGTFSEGSTSPVGLFGLLYYPGIALGTFVQYAFVIFAIGALYGVMAKTGVYGNLVNSVAKKYFGNEKLFLIIVIALITIASSVIGIPYVIFIVLPFLIAILTKLGFNKITCVSATFGSMLIGEIGSTFGLGISGMSKSVFGFEISEWILFKLGLLVVILFLFILFVLGHKETKIDIKDKEKKVSKTTKKVKDTKEKVVKEEVKKEPILFLENEVSTNKSSISLVILFIVTILFAAVSMYNLKLLFNITFFNDLYEQIINITVKDYPIFENILGLSSAFGTWDSYELVAILLISSCLIAWVYNLKFSEFIDGMVDGIKKMARPAFYITIANIVFTMMLVEMQNGTMLTFIIEKFASMSKDLNFMTATASGIVASLFYNNFNYLVNEVGSVYAIHITENFSILSFILQGTYGVMMMILPTSLILVTGLSMMNVSIKEWLKYIWKYVIQILLIVIVLSVIILLIA